jgi:DNA-binding NtrC family response regulator
MTKPATKPATLIGQHPAMESLRTLIARVAPSDAPVLVLGESGTGKELVARSLHAQSNRASAPFVAVNCGAIPADLLESELFGHERGAFTGATSARAGLFQAARGGTLFLDEIGELSPALQVKLLRVLQDGEVRPVGSDRTIRVDVRIIAATNRDLQGETTAGRFREDLFYRLNVIPVLVSPLRERRSDIAFLVAHILEKRQERSSTGPFAITERTMACLTEYTWPGNVRELENVIERVVVLADGPTIDIDQLPSCMHNPLATSRIPWKTLPEEGIDLTKAVDEFEMHLIGEAMRRSGGRKGAAARILGMKRTTLVDKLARWALPDTQFAEPAAAAA